jgi:hypothetical protein
VNPNDRSCPRNGSRPSLERDSIWWTCGGGAPAAPRPRRPPLSIAFAGQKTLRFCDTIPTLQLASRHPLNFESAMLAAWLLKWVGSDLSGWERLLGWGCGARRAAKFVVRSKLAAAPRRFAIRMVPHFGGYCGGRRAASHGPKLPAGGTKSTRSRLVSRVSEQVAWYQDNRLRTSSP